jgi:hypothetical protein
MARVRFSRPFDYKPKPGVIVAYKAAAYTVRRECADQAIAEGAAVELVVKARSAEPTRRTRARRRG